MAYTLVFLLRIHSVAWRGSWDYIGFEDLTAYWVLFTEEYLPEVDLSDKIKHSVKWHANVTIQKSQGLC